MLPECVWTSDGRPFVQNQLSRPKPIIRRLEPFFDLPKHVCPFSDTYLSHPRGRGAVAIAVAVVGRVARL